MRKARIDEAIKMKYPESVVMVVACDDGGRANAMPAGWFMFASGNPPMVAVSIAPGRYTHQLVSQTGQFVITFPGEGQAEMIEFCGNTSGRDVDKLARISARTLPASRVRPPLIEGSVACFECEVRSSLEAGDHTIFVGEIIEAHVSDGPLGRLYNLGGSGPERFKSVGPDQ
jgi:flavin reductase (DIM6/NTAB) family NADH-FMN oxidoreductase RutF